MQKPLTVWITKNYGKFLKRWVYQTTLLASWEPCMQVKKQQFELDMQQWIGFKIGKVVWQGYILSACLFNLYTEYIMQNGRLDESPAGIEIAGRNINNLRCIRLWCWEGLGAGGEGDDRGWDGWMASPTRWTWVWVNSGSWWWTGRPGVLQFMGLQRVGHDWAAGLNWTELRCIDDTTLMAEIEEELRSLLIKVREES